MPSDNDDESESSSGSGHPSPVPAVKPKRVPPPPPVRPPAPTAAKGILVHNNKKSANTNRVSFVAASQPSESSQSSASPSQSSESSHSSTPSSTPSPPVRHKHRGGGGGGGGGGSGGGGDGHRHGGQQRQHRRQSDAGGQLPYHMRTGRRLTGFGIKSHLHEFYDDPNDRSELFQDENGDDDDDFKYSVEPMAIRWRRHCGGVYTAFGLVVTAMGLMVMAAGHWIPAKDPFVGRSANVEVIDSGAVEFNELLASCRYAGSAVFAAGVVFSVVRFWVSVIRGDRAVAEKLAAAEASVAGGGGGGGGKHAEAMAASVADRLRHAERRRSSLYHSSPPPPPPPYQHTTVRIPVTGSVESVQPDPRTIHLRFDRAS